jgi:heparanase
MAWHSGRDNVTNTYLSGPWFISQLGSLAATHAFQCRQTLIGGYYELINKTTLAPNPVLGGSAGPEHDAYPPAAAY